MNKVSNFPNARKHDPDVVRTELETFRQIADLPPIDTDSPAEIKKRIDEYLGICTADGLMPTVQGVSLALHVHRSTFWTWSNEQSERGKVCQAFKTLQAALTEDIMLAGKVNVIAGIFLLKNHHGYKDTVSIDTDITPGINDRLPSVDDIRNRLILTAGKNESNTENDI